MRKLILALVALIPLVAACQRSNDALENLTPGSQVTVTRHDGQAITGRLAEKRSDALVVQPATGAPTTVPRKDIATVTISMVPANASGGAAAPAAPPANPSSAPATPPSAAIPAPDEGKTPAPAAPPPGAHGQRAAVPAPAPTWREVVLPEGTQLMISLDESVGSDTSRPEETVRATVLEPVQAQGVTAVPAGSIVSGTVTQAKRSGKVKGVAELAIRFDSIAPKGSDAEYRVRTGLVTRRAASTRRKDALEIGAPAAGGAILGGILGGKKGAVIGSTVGGGAGTAVVLSTRGKEVRLPRGTHLSIKLLEPVTIRVPA